MINDTYTFRTFVVGRKTNPGFEAARSVVANPARAHNPLVLTGGIGSGKTHLLYAIANALREARVLHVDVRTLVDRVIAGETFETFDIVLIDDVHLIAHRPAAQDELTCHIERLVANGVQVVIATDRREGLVGVLERRVRSTFVAEVEYPDAIARAEIVHRTANARNVPLRNRIQRRLVRRCTGSPREIQSRIARIEAQAALTKL